MPENVNNHHLGFARNKWRMYEFSRKVREHPGMILHNVSVQEHNALHREVRPIHPPSKQLAIVSLSYLMGGQFPDARQGAPPLTDYLWSIANSDTELGHQAFTLADHLEQQIAFFNLREQQAS